jgi:hypothetical protein
VFNTFKIAVQKQFNTMKDSVVFRSNVDKDLLWEKYLASFPEGTNPMFRTRTEFDCSCCRSFVRNAGQMVTIKDGKLVSIWDIKIDNFFQVVANAMSAFIKQHTIDNLFLNPERTIGTDKNFENSENGVITWNHFYIQLPNNLICKGADIGTKLSDARAIKDVMFRSLEEISLDAIDTVLELIAQNSLYRGEEHKFAINEFRKLKVQYNKLKSDKDIFCWSNISIPQSVSKIRNTVIGTLLVDISEDKDLEVAVKSFELKVAPANYKRPTSLVTKKMIEDAKVKVEELGITSSLQRRFATLEDITINNVLFANRSVKKVIDNVFDELASTTSVNPKAFDKVEEINIEKFLSDILPTATSLEVMVENRHVPNFVSLIAPSDFTSKIMFKWDNPFSWSYTGDVADSMKEKVKEAGGKVDGVLRFSIQWSDGNQDNSDLDAHCEEPTGHIYYKSRLASSGGNLDIDITRPLVHCKGKSAIENITWPTKSKMKDGVYKFYVNQFSDRNSQGFTAEIEFDGTIYSYSYNKKVIGNVQVAEVTLRDGVFTIKHILPEGACGGSASREIWNVNTQTFVPVSVVMNSPNYWDNKAVGNKHYFFMLEGCKNDGQARGFFNEFLTQELDKHRKVLEIVGSKMKVEESDNSLSGLGFSSTSRNSILCKVVGKITRVIKVTF